MRPQPSLILCGIALVLCATLPFGLPAQEGSVQQTAVIHGAALVPVAGMQVAVDADSGQLRAPTAAERVRLSAAMSELLQRAGADGAEAPVMRRADGSRTKLLDARYAHWMIAGADDQGTVGRCDAATAWLAAAADVDGEPTTSVRQVR